MNITAEPHIQNAITLILIANLTWDCLLALVTIENIIQKTAVFKAQSKSSYGSLCYYYVYSTSILNTSIASTVTKSITLYLSSTVLIPKRKNKLT